MIKSNYHTHTLFCDGVNTPREMAEQALALGFEALLGYLYLSDDRQRLREIAAEAVRIVDAKK